MVVAPKSGKGPVKRAPESPEEYRSWEAPVSDTHCSLVLYYATNLAIVEHGACATHTLALCSHLPGSKRDRES
jgi:hypothetical protein